MTMAQLPFDETSGTTAFDVTSNGWNGTLVGGASSGGWREQRQRSRPEWNESVCRTSIRRRFRR